MAFDIDFTGLCLFLRRDADTVDVLLGNGKCRPDTAEPADGAADTDHPASMEHAHRPFLAIDTEMFTVNERVPPDIVVVLPGQKQLALWDLKGRDVRIGAGGEVKGEDTIESKEKEGPPLRWGNLHWLVSFSEIHGQPVHGHPDSVNSPEQVPGLASRVRLSNGTYRTTRPLKVRKYVAIGPDKQEVLQRTFSETIRFTASDNFIEIAPFGGAFHRMQLTDGAEASITCQSSHGTLKHFCAYYTLLEPELPPAELKLSTTFSKLEGFPIDCVPPGGGP